MLRLAIGQLRNRAFRYLAVFFAIFAAVGLTVATAAIVQSLQVTVNGMFDKQYASSKYVAQVRSSDPIDLPDGAFDQQVSAVVKEQGNVYRNTTLCAIQDGSLQWRAIMEGRLPVTENEIAVVDDTPLGTTLELRVPASKEDVAVTVVGRVEQSVPEQLIGGHLLLVSADVLKTWAGSTMTGELRLSTEPQQLPKGVSDLKSGSQHTQQLASKYLSERDQYFLLLRAFMIIVAVVAVLVIFSSYSVIAAERQREFALLRAVGASSGQLKMSTAVEALILAALSGGIAIPAGLFAAKWAGLHAHRIGVRVPLTAVSLPPSWLAAIFLVGLLASVIASAPAASGAARKPLVESLSSAAPKQSPVATSFVLVAGMGLIAGSRYLMLLADDFKARKALVLSISSSGLLVLGVLLIMAVVFPWVLFNISRLMSSLPSMQLGMAFVGRQRLRSGALVAIVVAGSALVGAVLQGQHQMQDYLVNKATNKGAVDVAVRAFDGTMDEDLVNELQQVNGVAAMTTPRAVPVEFGGSRDTMLALSSVDGAPVLRGPITGADSGQIVLGINSALRGSLHDGEVAPINVAGAIHDLTVRLNDGPENYIDPAVMAEIADRLPQPMALIRVSGSNAQSATSPTVQGLHDAATRSTEKVSFQEAFTGRADVAEMAARILTLSMLMSIVALIIAGVGVLNTVTLMVRERARDLALLSAIGLGSGRRRIISLVELLFLVSPTAFIGVWLGGYLGGSIATRITGIPAQFTIGIEQYLVIGAATLMAAGVGILTRRKKE